MRGGARVSILSASAVWLLGLQQTPAAIRFDVEGDLPRPDCAETTGGPGCLGAALLNGVFLNARRGADLVYSRLDQALRSNRNCRPPARELVTSSGQPRDTSKRASGDTLTVVIADITTRSKASVQMSLGLEMRAGEQRYAAAKTCHFDELSVAARGRLREGTSERSLPDLKDSDIERIEGAVEAHVQDFVHAHLAALLASFSRLRDSRACLADLRAGLVAPTEHAPLCKPRKDEAD